MLMINIKKYPNFKSVTDLKLKENYFLEYILFLYTKKNCFSHKIITHKNSYDS